MLDTVFVFDIETITDCNAGCHLYGLNNLDDNAVSEAMFSIQHQTKGNEFLPHYLHQIVAISAIFRSHQQLKVWSLGEPNDSEKELIHRFFNGIEKHTPVLISW